MMRPREGVRLGMVFLALVGFGELGHQILERTGWEGAHHAFHLLYGAGAIAGFLWYAVRDIRQNGMPRFSWRLRPEAAPAHREDA